MGFTLAEVLITLGIIGIIAAMTLPAVIQNTKRQEASARLKKFVSTMEQAIIMSELENGSAIYWTQAGVVKDDNGNVDIAKSNAEVVKFYNRYLKKYLNTVTKIDQFSPGNANMKVYFADSTSVMLYSGACITMSFDVNGDSKPNLSGRDIFVFLICPYPQNELYHKNKKAFGTYAQWSINSREDAMKKCKEDPNTEQVSKSYCSNLLEIDNWEFKDDYPYKL